MLANNGQQCHEGRCLAGQKFCWSARRQLVTDKEYKLGVKWWLYHTVGHTRTVCVVQNTCVYVCTSIHVSVCTL